MHINIAFSRAFLMFNSLLHYYQQLHYIKQIDNIVHTFDFQEGII